MRECQQTFEVCGRCLVPVVAARDGRFLHALSAAHEPVDAEGSAYTRARERRHGPAHVDQVGVDRRGSRRSSPRRVNRSASARQALGLQLIQLLDRGHHLVERVAHEPRLAIGEHLWHRAVAERDHGRAGWRATRSSPDRTVRASRSGTAWPPPWRRTRASRPRRSRPMNSTSFDRNSGSITVGPVVDVEGVDLRGHPQRPAGPPRHLDRPVGSLLRRDPPDEGEVVPGRRAWMRRSNSTRSSPFGQVAIQRSGRSATARRWWSLMDTERHVGVHAAAPLRTTSRSSRPCIVNTVGTEHDRANGSVQRSVWAWTMSNSSGRPCGTPRRASADGGAEPPVRVATRDIDSRSGASLPATSVAAVSDPPAANRVTS